MADAKESGAMLPQRGVSGYDSPGFARAKAIARQIREDANRPERQN